MAEVPFLSGLHEIAARYDAVLCDIWGVVHDGTHAHGQAAEALARFRKERGPVLLVSNAPRPSSLVKAQLTKFGVAPDAYDGVLTSGDATRAELEKRGRDLRVHWIGPERDRPLFEGLAIVFCDLDEAKLIVCTGLFDDETETPGDYADLLSQARERGLEMICANPDVKVERGQDVIYCAGGIGEAYERIGGSVRYFGKPHAPIYASALAQFEKIRGKKVEAKRVLAIGDAVNTDIKGANGAGMDALFILSKLHQGELGELDQADGTKLGALFSRAGVCATAAMRRLRW